MTSTSRPPWSAWTRTVAAVAIAAVLLICGPSPYASASDDTETLVDSVDIERIRDVITTLQDFGSREFHLESSRAAAEFLHDEFADLGIPVEYQYFTVGNATVSNVVATLEGGGSGAETYLFGAHYDSENRAVYDLSTAENTTAPGADDDASGVASVLEMARLLKGSDFSHAVKFVMFGAEEGGYDDSGGRMGSRHYAASEAALGRTYAGTAILDMVGYREAEENRVVLVVNSPDYRLSELTERAVRDYAIDLRTEVLHAPSIVFSDHASFWELGMPSMLVIEELDDESYFPVNPHYHSSTDTVDRLSLEQVVAVTQALIGGLLLSEEDQDQDILVFGIALMSAAIVSVAIFIHFRRMKGRAEDDE